MLIFWTSIPHYFEYLCMYWGEINKRGDICWINVNKSNNSSKLKGQRISKYGSFSRESSQPRDRTQVSHIVDRCFISWATREVHIDYTKAFDYVDHNKLWKILRDGNTRPSYLPPEKSIYRSRSNRTGHGTMGWLTIGKEVGQGCILYSLFI